VDASASERPGGEKSPLLAGFSPPPRFRADPPLAGREETARVAIASISSDRALSFDSRRPKSVEPLGRN
jgi:hypothetical protein